MNPDSKFDRDTFYNLDTLEAMVAPMTARTFLEKLGLNRAGRNRVFEAGAFGGEILDALENVRKRLDNKNSCQITPVDPKPKEKRGRSREFNPI